MAWRASSISQAHEWTELASEQLIDDSARTLALALRHLEIAPNRLLV